MSIASTQDFANCIGLSKHPEFISPFLIACSTRNAKYSATAVQCLHTLINFEGLPPDRIVEVLDALKEATHLGVEIQLKILQSLPSLIQNYGDYMFNQLIVELLLICYILQGGNKIPVVVNTALATLQQLIISVFDKVVKEDSLAVPLPKTFEVPIDTNDKILVSPAAYDALRVFLDISNLIEHQKPLFLQFGQLPETVGLELIESILTTHSDIFINHVEFCYVLRTRAVPLLLRAFSEKRDFPVTVRVTRILYLLIRKQLSTLVVECEVILSLLTHMLEPDAASYWKRVLCMEVFQGVCSEFSLIQNIYQEYDFQDGRRAIVKSCVLALDKLCAESPDVIGLGKVSTPIVVPDESQLQRGSTASSITTLTDFTNGTVTRASFDLGQIKGISLKTSTVRSSCIDLLDKSEPPQLPPSYLYYLALQCINSLSEGLARSVFANSAMDKKRKLASMPFISSQTDLQEPPRSRSPSPARHTTQSGSKGEVFDQTVVTTSLVNVCWPELLSSYTTFFQATTDSDMYRALVRSAQKFAHASGILGILDSRDAFLSLLGKFSVAVLGVDSAPAVNPKSGGLLSMETLVGSLSPAIARDHIRSPSSSIPAPTPSKPVLTSRNVLCFRALLNLGIALGPSLGQGWAILLETIQYSNFLINGINADKRRGSVSKGDMDYNIETAPLPFSQLGSDFQSVENSIRRLLDSSRDYSVSSFYDLISSITNLSSLVLNTGGESAKEGVVVAGIGKLEDCDPLFLLDFLGAVCNRNASRFITLDEQEIKTWNLLTNFLITVQTSRQLNADFRVRAAQVLNEVIRKNSFAAADLQKEQNSELSQRAQDLVLTTLTEEVKKVVVLGLPPDGTISLLTVESKLHVMAIDYLNKILDQCGGTLQKGWDIVFDIIDTVFGWLPEGPINMEVQNRRLLLERSNYLVKSGFESLQLICNDFLENLPTSCLIRLIDTLYKFCHQEGDLNISFTSISFFWIVSDNLRSILGEDVSVDLSSEVLTKQDLFEMSQKSNPSDSLNALWMIALLRLAAIAYDSRPQVRNGAVQILFRIFEAHGSQLPPRVWKACQVIVLEAIMSHDPFSGAAHTETVDTEWCETLSLSFAGLGNTYSTFMPIFVKESHFEQLWTRLLDHFQKFTARNRLNVSHSVYKSLYTILEGVSKQNIEFPENCIDRTWEFWVSQAITPNTSTPKAAQDTYTALVELHAMLARITKQFPQERITAAVNVLQKCATYPVLSPYSSDRDHLSPLQAAALKEIESIKLDSLHNSEQVLKLLAKLVALPFDETVLANIAELASVPTNKEQFRRPTFVALSVHALQYLKTSLEQAKQYPESFVTGTAVQVTQALLIPINAKFNGYIIPGGKPQLWQLATTRFLELVEMAIVVFATAPGEASAQVLELWDLFADGAVGILLAGHNVLKSNKAASSPELQSLQASAEFEAFDIESYNTFIKFFITSTSEEGSSARTVAELGVSVPSSFWIKVLQALFQASFIYDMPRFLAKSSTPVIASLQDSDKELALILPPREAVAYIVSNTFFGSTVKLVPKPRQNLAYICMAALALLATPGTTPATSKGSSKTGEEQADIAELATEYLTLRVALVLYLFITDHPLRGKLPMPKIQRRELVKALELVVEVGSTGTGQQTEMSTTLVPLFPLIVKAIPIAENDKPILNLLQMLLLKIGQAKSIHP